MKIVKAILANGTHLPPVEALGYEYVIAAGGLYIRAEDSRIEALLPITPAQLHGLADVEPYARLKVPRVPADYLWSVLESARRALPREAMYQFIYDAGQWRCVKPAQVASHSALGFEDVGQAVIDLHSHAAMEAFYSPTDDADEIGLRFYAVIGKVNTNQPEIVVRAGVYGHHWLMPASEAFEGLGPFREVMPEDGENQVGYGFN